MASHQDFIWARNALRVMLRRILISSATQLERDAQSLRDALRRVQE